MSFRKNSEASDSLIMKLLRRALIDPPSDYNPQIFLKRSACHLLVYGLLLISAIFVVMFVYRPIETGFILVVLVGAYSGISELVARNSSSREASGIYVAAKFPPVVLYILAASFLWKEITDGTVSKFVERSLFSG